MENYTDPNNPTNQQIFQDLLNASLLFGRAANLMLENNHGIVVDVVGDCKLADGSKKVIVHKQNDGVHILTCDDNVAEGTIIKSEALIQLNNN